jgi:fluoride exporter
VGPQPYPWATLGINVAGSCVLGGLLVATPRLPEQLSVALAVGLLGAFTTFSTFSVETLTLLRTGHVVAAISYATASVVLGLAGRPSATGYCAR